MSGFEKVIPCAAIAAIVFAASPRLTGQAPVQNGRPVALAAAQDTLPAALDRVDAMLTSGDLNISSLHDDTLIAGRAFERLAQFHEGLPVFGATGRAPDGRPGTRQRDRTPLRGARHRRESGYLSGSGARAGGRFGRGRCEHPWRRDARHPARPERYRLVYRMLVLSDWAIREIFVDADSGAIVLSINGIQTQAAVGQGSGIFGTLRKMSTNRTTSTYQAVDKLRPAQAFTLAFSGTPARLNLFLQTLVLFNSDIATDSDNVWTDGPAVDAHVFQGWAHDYYYKRFGRNGMDDRNIEVDSIVHPLSRSEANRQPPDIVGTYINNAFYCCDGILVFGDGDGRLFTFLAGGFDVVAHEWTHGVTDYTSELIYRDESGALNEAFSDIMGAAMEFYYQPVGSGRDQADWLIAEEVYVASPGYLRSLIDPAAKGYPNHYSLRRYIGTDTDDGGVHFNATIGGHAFYLAVAGGRNTVSGITVPGVGLGNIERMERIFFRAFTQLMTPGSQYSDARRATLQAATDLYGAGSNERAQVELAWTAVGVN